MGGGASVAKKDDLPKYVHTLRKSTGDKVEKTLVLVEQLSGAQENKISMCHPTLGLLAELCNILRKNNGKSRYISLSILHNLSSVAQNNAALMDESLQLIELLLDIIVKAKDLTPRETSFCILLNLCSNPNTAISLFHPAIGLIPALVTVLNEDNKELCKLSLALLTGMLMHPAGASTTGNLLTQLLPPLTKIMLNKGGSQLSKAIVLVRRIMETSTSEIRVFGSSFQSGLLNALMLAANKRENGAALRSKALQALNFILSESTSVLNVATPGNGIIAAISELVLEEEISVDARDVLDTVLKCNTVTCKTYLALSDAGVTSTVTKILSNKLDPMDRKKWAVSALKALLSVEDNRKLVGAEKNGLVPVLISYIRTRPPELLTDILSCILALATHEVVIPQLTVSDYELLRNLVNIISMDKGDNKFLSLGILLNISFAPNYRGALVTYQLGLLPVLTTLLGTESGENFFITLKIIHNLSISDDDTVWFTTPELGLFSKLVEISTSVAGDSSKEKNAERKVALLILRNMSQTPSNRHFMATPRVGLIPMLLEKCKSNKKKGGSSTAVELLSNIAEDVATLCEPFVNYDFFSYLIGVIESSETAPPTWKADSRESVALTCLMNTAQWPQCHNAMLGIQKMVPTLLSIGTGDDIQSMKAVLTIAMLIGALEDEEYMNILKERKICERIVDMVIIERTRSSRNLSNIPHFPLKLTLRALWNLVLLDANKSIIISSPKLIRDLSSYVQSFVSLTAAEKFHFDYDISKRVVETVLDVLLSISMMFPSSMELLASEKFTKIDFLLKALSSVQNTDLNASVKKTAAFLGWRLRNESAPSRNNNIKNFIALIYYWPSPSSARPELIECFAKSLKAMDYNVVLVENGICKESLGAPWELEDSMSYPDVILTKCSAAVIAISSGFNDSATCRLMAHTAASFRVEKRMLIEFISLESDFSINQTGRNSSKKCNSWVRQLVSTSKILPLWNIAHVDPSSNKIGEIFDGSPELRGKMSRQLSRSIEYVKKEPKGNEKRYDVAWGILQVPCKAKNKEELENLIASIGVYSSKDLQLCDFDDLMYISSLLKKIQMRNFIEMVFEVATPAASAKASPR